MAMLSPIPATRAPEIPKVIHHVWVGDAPPMWVERSWDNWRLTLDEGWQLKIWDNSEIQAHPVFSKTWELARSLDVSWRGLSNLLRVQIVGWLGGIYTDVDCLQLANIDHLAGERPGWVAVNPKSRKQLQMENSCFGFPAGHPFMGLVWDDGRRALSRGVRSDFFLGGSRSFRTVWNKAQGEADEVYGMETFWNYLCTGDLRLRRGLRDITELDREEILSTQWSDRGSELFHPFPITHVWKPRL